MNICGDVYHVGDVVELESEDELWLGQLIALKMGPRRTRRCVVNWFYKPRDVDRGSTKGKVLAANEVFFSEHRDDNYVDCITRRVRVHLLNPGDTAPKGKGADYVCRFQYHARPKGKGFLAPLSRSFWNAATKSRSFVCGSPQRTPAAAGARAKPSAPPPTKPKPRSRATASAEAGTALREPEHPLWGTLH